MNLRKGQTVLKPPQNTIECVPRPLELVKSKHDMAGRDFCLNLRMCHNTTSKSSPLTLYYAGGCILMSLPLFLVLGTVGVSRIQI